MSVLLLLAIFIVIFIFDLVLLAFALKKNKAKNWVLLFVCEIASVSFSALSEIYFDSLPMYGFLPGLSYIGEILLSKLAFYAYTFVLFGAIVSRIITFEADLKQQGKRYANPLVLILAVVLIFTGVLFTRNEIVKNWGKTEGTGVVTGFENVSVGGQTEQHPIISFYVDGKKYQDTYPESGVKVGDKLVVYYSPIVNGYEVTTYHADNRAIYIPCYALGLGVALFRLFKKQSKKKTDESENPTAYKAESSETIKNKI